MSDTAFQDIFALQTVLQNIEIRLSARIENGWKKLLAIVTGLEWKKLASNEFKLFIIIVYRDGDIVLHYTNGEFAATVKRVTWFTDSKKSVEAICFDPTATWLLAVGKGKKILIQAVHSAKLNESF